MSTYCDMCAGPLPWKPYRAAVISKAVTCCTLACVQRLQAVWRPTPRYPIMASVWLGVAITMLALATLA